MTFVRDRKFNRYEIRVDGKLRGFVFGKAGNWRAYSPDHQIVREARTRVYAAERLIRATDPIIRPAIA